MGVVSIGSISTGAQEYQTRDKHLVAALMAIGFRPLGKEPFRVVTYADRPGSSYQFAMPEHSECGRYEYGAMAKAWAEGLGWIEKHPEHPFAYAMAAAMNYEVLTRHEARAVPKVAMRRGKSIGILPLNASAELEEKILGNFE